MSILRFNNVVKSYDGNPVLRGIFFALVTLGAALVAMPLGVTAAVCLSDILPFTTRQWAKPVIEMLAAIPSVAYGFIALALAPLMMAALPAVSVADLNTALLARM